MKTKLKIRDEWNERVVGYVSFDDDTWTAIGRDGSGHEGHYSSQGYRTLYASPRPNKSGKHYFVLQGTGYYPTVEGGSISNGGLTWRNQARVIDLDCALDIMDPEHLTKYAGLQELSEASNED